jgi:hypothetical protein
MHGSLSFIFFSNNHTALRRTAFALTFMHGTGGEIKEIKFF